uniref:Uncharacterized protein n=1 Tax=Anguilla anguilla TaxID=7936 RepID=A0A0E9W980_ANGAN
MRLLQETEIAISSKPRSASEANSMITVALPLTPVLADAWVMQVGVTEQSHTVTERVCREKLPSRS